MENEMIYTVGYYVGFYSTLIDQIWQNGDIFEKVFIDDKCISEGERE